MQKEYTKRNRMQEIEREIQREWEEKKVFESDPVEDKESYFVTFPYAYMNGLLHLGHLFTISKAEFAAGFEMLRGKKILFPFGFHCTGMPIVATAMKLQRELAENKETKQREIIRSFGVGEDEVEKFVDPWHWVGYFPEQAQKDMALFGARIDWRRSFITTDKNPFYDSFVRWQFNKLKRQGRILYGKRPTIFSKKDNQPCLDHDRQTGEGLGVVEETAVKMRIQSGGAIKECGCENVFLVAVTLRPETLIGQTNCWVHPDLVYGVYRMKNGDCFIMGEHGALNMEFQQGLFADLGEARVGSVTGADLIGMEVETVFALRKKSIVLPLFSIDAELGTGVVCSVPSDSPDDYIGLCDLKQKEGLRKKYGLGQKAIEELEPVPIIAIPGYGDLIGPKLCADMKIKSQNDTAQLKEAKEIAYKEGYTKGVMAAGPYSGSTVSSARKQAKEELEKEGHCFTHYEPEGKIVSRTGDVCVVGLCEQWYIDYGSEEWKQQVRSHMRGMEFYSPETRDGLERAVEWIREWPCSRRFGLGSRLPWDRSWLIDSLSDSTLYQAYYTVAHILHGGSLDGGTRPRGVSASEMTDAVWEWVLCGKKEELPSTTIPEEVLLEMKQQFEFFYPVDMRVSGKDLLPNHLTFYLFIHVALLGRAHWPRGIRANGHLLLNAEKMSKSTGNFLTVREGMRQYTSDALRIVLANAGDFLEDGNFSTEMANSTVLRLYTLVEQAGQVLEEGDARSGETAVFADVLFWARISHSIDQAFQSYSEAKYREALKTGFFDMQNSKDGYLSMVGAGADGTEGKVHGGLLRFFFSVQTRLLFPIAPHVSEYIWTRLLKNKTSLCSERWPENEQPEFVRSTADTRAVLFSGAYLDKTVERFRKELDKKRKKVGKRALSGSIRVAEDHSAENREIISIVEQICRKEEEAMDTEIVSCVRRKFPKYKHGIPFAKEVKKAALLNEISFLSGKKPLDERVFMEENSVYIRNVLGLQGVSTHTCSNAKPGVPLLELSEE
ncbi:MAG: leucyl-tRNA synthetase [Amphiamblys sp. WSBS2006]|nr:MAG: leucyl-tRNA synthetase [Amphiamblys sp. WSBS2006]